MVVGLDGPRVIARAKTLSRKGVGEVPALCIFAAITFVRWWPGNARFSGERGELPPVSCVSGQETHDSRVSAESSPDFRASVAGKRTILG